MKDYEQVTRDVFRKRDIYLEKRRKRIAYIEKGVSIMSIAGILVVLGLCTSMSSSIAPALQDEPNEIDINSGISTVTSQTAQTEQTARTIQDSTAVLTSTGLTSTSADMTSNSSSDVTSDTAASSAVRSVLTLTGSTAEETTKATASATETTQGTTDTTAVSTTGDNTTTESTENDSVISGTYGNGFIWTISGDTLTFALENEEAAEYAVVLTDGCDDDTPTPWNEYLPEIRHIVFGEKISSAEIDVTCEFSDETNIETITCSDDFVWDDYVSWMKFRTNGGTLIAPKYSQSDYFAFRNDINFEASGIAENPYLKLSAENNAWKYIEDSAVLEVYNTDNDNQWYFASRWYGRYDSILITESAVATEEPAVFDVKAVSGGVNYDEQLDPPTVYCYPNYEYIDYLRESDDVNLVVIGEENAPNDNENEEEKDTNVNTPTVNDGVFTFAYRLCENGTRERTIYIDKAELEKGDYTISTAIYIETEDSPSGLMSADAGWFGFDNNGDRTKYITFDNCSAYSEENDLVTTDAMYAAIKDSDIIDGVNINSSFAPSCFTTIREKSSGTTLKHWPSAPRYTYSTISVSNPGNYPNGDYTLYSAGPYKVYFTRDYDGKTYYVDLEYDEKSGTATGVCEELEAGAAYGPANVRIHHYDPETPVDEPIIKSFTHACLIDISAPTEEWFGGASDYLPFVTFDSIIDQDTPAGTYYVGFTPTNIVGSEMNAMCCKTSMELLLAENVDKEHNDQSYWLKIVVGDSAETEDDTAYDVNLDGTIGVDDATEVLSIYAEAAAGTNSDIQIQQAANVNADVDGDGAVTLSDATAILTRYAEKASGLE